MNHTLLRNCTLLLLLGLGVFGVRLAPAAISCSSATMSNIAFGNVDPQSTQSDSTATLNYTCENDGLLAWSAKLCFSIGVPGGGSMNPRQMQDGATHTLNFQLFQNPARSVIWGSQFFGAATPLIVNITIPGRVVLSTPPVIYSGTATMYGRVLGGQAGVFPGAYSSIYGASDTFYTVKDRIGSTPPATCDTTQLGQFPFAVSANIINKCTVTAGPLDFGTSPGLLNTAVNASTTLSVQCSNTTPYNVGLDAGQNSAGNINARKMVLGTNNIGYQLYRDATRTQVWGNTVGTNTVAGTGSGNTQNLTVYGTVPVQATPPAGTYNDTVVVTVTY